MTEIPEHLLKRSKERRAALGLGGETETAAAAQEAVAAATAPSGAAAPARVESAAPATKAGGAAPPKAPRETPAPAPAAPLPPYIEAANRRKRIPYWVMPVVALLPLWGFMYMEAMSPPKVEVLGPLAEGETLFNAKCSSCHLTNGAGDTAGGVGRQLNNGEVLKTFETLPEQVAYIRRGSYPVGTPYGNPNREGGQHIARGGMPAHPQSVLTNAELTAIVCHVRITLSGEDPATDATWCAEDASVVVDASDDGTIVNPEAPK